MSEFIGKVYIVCFERAFLSGKSRPIKHYIGFGLSVKKRMFHHENGSGSKLLAAVGAAGIKFAVSRVFENVPRGFERKLKNHKNAADYCPNCCKSPRTPKGYVAPKQPEKRKWKIGKTLDGLPVVQFTRLASTRELLTRVAKRFRVGEKLVFQDKILQRIKKRRGGEFWKLESADLVGFIKSWDESIPFGEKEYRAALERFGGELRRESIGHWGMIQTDLHESTEIADALRLSSVCFCGHSKEAHDEPDTGACIEYCDPADFAEIERVEKDENDIYYGYQIAPNGDELNLDADDDDRENDYPPACIYPPTGY